ncbi:Lysine-specific demethylase 3B, partial [Coemansia biformis]
MPPRLVRVAFDAQAAADDGDLLDPMMCVAAFRIATGRAPSGPPDLQCVRRVWVAEMTRLRQGVRRSSRSTRAMVDYSIGNELTSLQPGVANSSAAAAKRLAAGGERKKSTGKRARAEQSSTAQSDATVSIAEQINASGEALRVKTADNRPDAALLVREDGFIPLVFPRMNNEPPHCLADPRASKQLGKTRRQVQAVHEFAVDGFPVPLHPDRWLQQQREKYCQWLMDTVRCRSVTVENEVQDPRQSNCYCRFRAVRLVTTITMILSSGESVTRYLLVPIFCDEKNADKSTRLLVSPLSIPACCVDQGFGGIGDSLSSSSSSSSSSSDVDIDGSGGSRDRKRRSEQQDEEWADFYNLLTTASTLQVALDAIRGLIGDDVYGPADDGLEYLAHPQLGCSGAPCVRRAMAPGNRQFCDICATSILGAHYACSGCWLELCPRCFAEWDDSAVERRVVDLDQGEAAPRISMCKRLGRAGGRLRAAALHQRQQFLRVSLLSVADVDAVAQKTQEMIRLCGTLMCDVDCGGLVSASELSTFDAQVLRLCHRSRQMHRLAAWELPVVSVAPGELSTREFSRLWRRGHVVVVRGLLDQLDGSIWEPEWWIRNFGYEMVNILDCARGAEPAGVWPLRDFYRLFDGPDDCHQALFDQTMEDSSDWPAHRDRVRSSILKLKDWPPADDFQTRLPEHFARFMGALPFPEYTQRQGRFNLASCLPAEFVPPDLGPKMYCAYGSSDAEGG